MLVFAHAQEKFWNDIHKIVTIEVISGEWYSMESDGEERLSSLYTSIWLTF